MPRLLIHVEGATEEGFVNSVLADHLQAHGYMPVSARILGNARLRQRRGGIRSWASARNDIVNHLKEDPGCIATTMVDYYGLPHQGAGGWPGRADARHLEGIRKAPFVEEALRNDVVAVMESRFRPERFVPFVVMHEFEGLLFSDCGALSQAIGRPDLEPAFREIRNQFDTPEDINDSPVTAPSKRLQNLLPGYEKPLLGQLAALRIGLTAIRAECPHFDNWLRVLEDVANQPH